MKTAIDCAHLRANMGHEVTPFGELTVYRCACQEVRSTTLSKCLSCRHYLVAVPDARRNQLTTCPHPEGTVVDRYEHPAGMAGLYRGASCFLVLGGPSIKSMDMELLRKRGVLIMSVNNCPAGLPDGIRPHIWTHSDPTGKFHDSIWRDPSILKFTPVKRWNSKYSEGAKTKDGDQKLNGLRKRRADGDGFEALEDGICARDMPAIFGYHRNANFCPDHYMHEPTFNMGNDKQHSEGTKGSKPNGWDHVINTMFTAVRLAYYLGVGTLYLVGADFTMNPDEPYSFGQGKHGGGCNSNNGAYAKMATMFTALRPLFDEAGFTVRNCTPNSGLWAFEYISLEAAITEATEGFEETLDGSEWYTPVRVK